jgi:DNA invertase Pin-like site-specific DNA recombinase
MESKRVALYARVSTHDQTTANQLLDLRRYCLARNWQTIGEFIDQGISGSKDNRPALKRLMDFARKRKIDIILVWKLDRFGRSVNHLVNSLEELRTLGVDFVSFTESLDTTTAQGRLVFNVMASIAEFERCLIVERVVAGLRRASAQGKAIGRPKVEIDRAKASLLASQGHSHRAIGRSLGVSRMTVSRALSQKPPVQSELLTVRTPA